MIDPALKSRLDMAAAWSGIIGIMLFGTGWAAIAGFVFPIHSPAATADQIASLYTPNLGRIRLGMILVMFSALLTIPFSALIVKIIARVEGGFGMLSMCALLGGVANMLFTFYPAMWWLLAAFRPERSPDLILLINDAAWLQLIGGVSLFLALPLSMTIVAFADKSETPAFPRWSGYVNLWAAVLLLPDQLIFFFKRGVFAWNGLVGFFVPLVALSGWYLTVFVLVRRNVLNQRSERFIPDTLV